MSDYIYGVLLEGGGPWGIRVQGGKDFGTPLIVSRVTTGSKAFILRMRASDHIVSINGVDTDDMTHLQAQEILKHEHNISLKLKQGPGLTAKDYSLHSSPTSPSSHCIATDNPTSGAPPSSPSTTWGEAPPPGTYRHRHANRADMIGRAIELKAGLTKFQEQERYMKEQGLKRAQESETLRMLQEKEQQQKRDHMQRMAQLQMHDPSEVELCDTESDLTMEYSIEDIHTTELAEVEDTAMKHDAIVKHDAMGIARQLVGDSKVEYS